MVKAISNNNDLFLGNFVSSLNRQVINLRQAILHQSIDQPRLKLRKLGGFVSKSKILLKIHKWN